MDFSDLEPSLIDATLAELRRHEPDTVAVLVTGSYCRGTAERDSDLDLTAITPAPRTAYRTWFAERAGAGQPPLHVSLGARTAADWDACRAEPADWSLGFPAVITARYVWTAPDAVAPLGDDPSLRHPAGEPELEDFIEAVMKVRRAARIPDVLGVRWAAQQAGHLAPRLLIPLNPSRVVHDRRDALSAALDLPKAPPDFAAQLATCLGLNPAHAGEVAASTVALGAGLLAFLRQNAPNVDDQPDLARLLADGTLERHLASSGDVRPSRHTDGPPATST